MAMLERLPPSRSPSPIIRSPKESAEKDIVPSASEDEGVATGASTSEENDEIHNAIPRTTLVFSTPLPKAIAMRVAIQRTGSKEYGESKDRGASLRDVTNEGTVSVPAPTIEAIGRKVVPLPDRGSKKRFASATFDHPTLPSTTTNFPLSQLPTPISTFEWLNRCQRFLLCAIKELCAVQWRREWKVTPGESQCRLCGAKFEIN